jgi:tetratricopeptide (TPR) repeat protein
MGQRAAMNGYLDAALEIFKLVQRRQLDPGDREELARRIPPLEQAVEETTAKIEQRVEDIKKQVQEKAPEQAAQTEFLVQRMQLYRNNGLPAKALAIFEEASPNNPEIEAGRIAAIEMYLELGFAEKAQEHLNLLPPNALPRKGDLQYLNAIVLLAAGQYDNARQALEQALSEIRMARLEKGLNAVDGLLRGAPLLSMSDQGPTGPIVARMEIVDDLGREARLGFELGLVFIEMGKPRDAVKAFNAALEAYPRATIYRPIMDYYVDLMKKAGLSDAKLPPDPPVYVQEDELSVKFDPPPDAPKDAGKAPAKADEKKVEAPKADAPKKDAPKKNDASKK